MIYLLRKVFCEGLKTLEYEETLAVRSIEGFAVGAVEVLDGLSEKAGAELIGCYFHILHTILLALIVDLDNQASLQHGTKQCSKVANTTIGNLVVFLRFTSGHVVARQTSNWGQNNLTILNLKVTLILARRQ